jgi:hypothetical protein
MESPEPELIVLKVAEFFPDDSGALICRIKVGDDVVAMSACSILVTVPDEPIEGPVFDKFPTSLTVDEGSNATFECRANAPVVKIEWYRSDTLLSPSEGYQQEATEQDGSLTISDAKFSDTGLYSVKLTDSEGRQREAACALQVVEKSA